MDILENPEIERIVLVTEPVHLRVVGAKKVEDEVTEDLDVPDPDPEVAKAILKAAEDVPAE